MSETLTNIAEQLVNITVPNLNEAGYADKLSKTFTDINTNFIKLANRDFVKGENGDSVKIREVDLIVSEGDDKGELTVFGTKLIEAIEANTDENERSNIYDADGSVLTWKDYFLNNPGKLYVIYDSTAVTTDDDVAYSSLYYTFLDGRYINSKIGGIDPKTYQLIKDVSCIAVYDGTLNDGEGGFNIISNAFPTIYYEEGIGLCWKVSGAGTGIPVQGIPGKNGNNASMYLVQATITESPNLGVASEGRVLKVFEAYYGYRDLDKYEDLSKYDNMPALILAADTNGLAGKDFYFGTLKVEDVNGNKQLWAYCSPSTSITTSIGTESFINSMKNIDILGTSDAASSTPKGLFIPMADETIDENTKQDIQPVHLLSATSITNEEGSNNNLKTDVVFTPVKDYNSVTVDSENPEKNNIIVDKYLYVKLRQEDDTITDNISENSPNQITTRYKGVLKYKLESVVNSLYGADFNVYKTSDKIEDNPGSRLFSKIDGVQLNDTNVAYKDYDGNTVESTTTSDHFYSMPKKARERFVGTNPVGLYKWVLCRDIHDWDIDELIEAQSTENLDPSKGDNYSFSDVFRVIYTLDITPGANSTFMWFDGFTFKSEAYKNEETPREELYYNNKPIIRGWYTELFDFIKFVPIYINSYFIDNDTSLNLNYNVNITGDKKNPNKSITVHGNVNCDNLNVYKLTATGAIQNIYTEDSITSTRGMQLCKSNDDSGNEYFNFIVEDGGDVIAKQGVRATSVNCTKLVPIVLESGETDWESEVPSEDETVIATHIKSNTSLAKDLTVKINEYNDAELTIKQSTVNSDELGISATHVNDINIKSVNYTTNENSKDSTYNTTVPVLTSDLPTHLNNNASIVVSNQDKGSNEIYFRDVKKDIDSKKPAGEGVNVNEVTFDSAKNFNINRFYAKSSNSKTVSVGLNGVGLGTMSTDSSGKWPGLINISTGSTGAFTAASPAVTQSYIPNASVQEFVISNSDTFDGVKCEGIANSAMTIKFNKDFICHVGVRGSCSNGRWPVLQRSSSWLKLSVWVASSKNKVPVSLGISTKYIFDYSKDNYDNDNGYGWSGYNAQAAGLGGNYKDNWRFYSFKFRPTSITISGSALKTLRDKITNEKQVSVYIVAEAQLCAKGQKNIWGNSKDVVSGLYISCPRPINETKMSAGTTLKKQSTGIRLDTSAAQDGSTLSLKYISLPDTESNVKSTTICDDGIVMRAGNYTFGLGYSTEWADHSKGYTQSTTSLWDESYIVSKGEPVLFYYDTGKWQYNKADAPSATNRGYARRVNTVRLSELFDALKTIRQNENYNFGL